MADKKVILEVELIEGNAQSKLDALRTSLQGLDKTHKDYKPTLELITQAERDLSKVQQKRILIEKGLISSSTKVDNSTKKTAKQMKQLSSDTGASTSATLELGRVFSDAPYGIRGVANNIQQLASNLFFMSKKTNEATGKTVGFGGAVGSLLKNLIGPAGILVAFQAGIALLDYFSGGMKKAGSSADEYAESLKGLEKTLSTLYTTQEDVNLKFDDYAKLAKLRISTDAIIKKEASKLFKLNKQIAEQEEFNKIAKGRRGEKKREEVLNKLLTKRNLIYTITTNAKAKLNEETEKFNSAKAGTVKALEKTKSGLLKEQKTLSSTSEKWKEYADKIKKVQAEIDAITGGKKKKGKNRDKVFELGLDSVDIGAEAKKGKKMLKAVADAMGIDMKKDPLEIDTNLDLTLSPEAKKAAADALKAQVDEMVRQSELEDLASYAEKAKEIIGGMGDFANAEFDRELTIEQNKTNALNNELNIRLQNENLSKEQRQSIQNQIAQNDEKLRVKQEAIERKRFKMQKAVDISTTIMNTAVAMMKALKIYGPTPAGFIAAGVAAAQGAVQVATIARQKFQTSSGNSPRQATGSSGSGGRAEPSFNIVGRSNDNILLSAIQSQFDKPLKAYVVARDVTNQQQLDGVISTSAST